MPDYKNAVMHMLEPSIDYDDGDIYYGSTTQTLYKRFFNINKVLDVIENVNLNYYLKNMALKMLK